MKKRNETSTITKSCARKTCTEALQALKHRCRVEGMKAYTIENAEKGEKKQSTKT